jgi:hypothetical protein
MSELSVYGPGVRVQGLVLGGVNYCRSHCRLAKFCDFMYGEIQRCGWTNNVFFVCAQYESPGYGFFQANHSAVFQPVYQTTKFSPNDSVSDSS